MFFQHGGIKHLIHIWPVEQKPRNLLRCCFCVNKYLIAALVLFLNCAVEGEPTKSGPKNESVAVKCEDSYSEFNSGMAYCRNKQWDEAIISFKKAIVLNPTNSLAYTCCGGAFFAKGEFIDAINCFSKAIKLDKTNSELYMNRAGAYRELGFLSKAMEDYNKSIKLNPSNCMAFRMRAGASHAKGQFKKEVADWNECLRLNPNNAASLFYRSWALFKIGKYADAIRDSRDAIRIDATNGFYYNSLAWIRATCPNGRFRSGKEAVETATKACELTDWKETDCIDTLAAAYAESREFAKAIKYQQMAIALGNSHQKKTKDMIVRLQKYEHGQTVRDGRDY